MGDSHRCLYIITTRTSDRKDRKEERRLCLIILRDLCSSWPWWRRHGGPRIRSVHGGRGVCWKTVHRAVAPEAERVPEVGHTITFKRLILVAYFHQLDPSS